MWQEKFVNLRYLHNTATRLWETPALFLEILSTIVMKNNGSIYGNGRLIFSSSFVKVYRLEKFPREPELYSVCSVSLIEKRSVAGSGRERAGAPSPAAGARQTHRWRHLGAANTRLNIDIGPLKALPTLQTENAEKLTL